MLTPTKLSDNPPCQGEACAIQTCLSQNSFNQEKCNGVLNKLYEWWECSSIGTYFESALKYVLYFAQLSSAI